MIVRFAFTGADPAQRDERDYDDSGADGEFCFGVQYETLMPVREDSIILVDTGGGEECIQRRGAEYAEKDTEDSTGLRRRRWLWLAWHKLLRRRGRNRDVGFQFPFRLRRVYRRS